MNKLTLNSTDPEVITRVQLFAQAANLPLEIGNVTTLPVAVKPQSIKEMEVKAIEAAISFHKGNLTKAAQALEVGRATLYRKIKEYNIVPKVINKAA